MSDRVKHLPTAAVALDIGLLILALSSCGDISSSRRAQSPSIPPVGVDQGRNISTPSAFPEIIADPSKPSQEVMSHFAYNSNGLGVACALREAEIEYNGKKLRLKAPQYGVIYLITNPSHLKIRNLDVQSIYCMVIDSDISEQDGVKRPNPEDFPEVFIAIPSTPTSSPDYNDQ